MRKSIAEDITIKVFVNGKRYSINDFPARVNINQTIIDNPAVFNWLRTQLNDLYVINYYDREMLFSNNDDAVLFKLTFIDGTIDN